MNEMQQAEKHLKDIAEVSRQLQEFDMNDFKSAVKTMHNADKMNCTDSTNKK